MRRLYPLLITILLLTSGQAFAQCNGQSAPGSLCANAGAATGLPAWVLISPVLDRNFGAPSAQGTILNRGSSLWAATATPTLGKNGTAGGSVTLQGSSSGSAVVGVKAAAGSTTFNLPVGNGTLNQVLITDGSGNTSWTTAGAGTVSSVGLTLPGIFSVSGSPVTGAGTLTATLANQSANLIWAGPNTGAAAAPTFRSLVGADLPNPSSSSLGGIQSFAGVGSQWIRQISTSGVPSASQPAFNDISGTLSPTQCPNPSASTTGCVQSFALQASKWINTISTAGVPSASQPGFTDISGNASLSQLPTIGNNSVLANNSGGSAIPSALTASNILDMIANTQGDVLYRNASGWTVLAPGTNGQVLSTGGAAANPSWTTVTGVGTVTSVATNNGLTGGTITASGTIGLATITAGSVLANITGGSAIPIANTPSSILDLLGSTQGNILYRGASAWQVLAPGTNGQVLTQGASTPAWGSAGTVSNVTITPGTGLAATGTCNITTTGTCAVALSAARQTLPTYQTLTSGSGATYTPTSGNVLWIEVLYCGGGGGGSGVSSTANTFTAGLDGAKTTFNGVDAAPGKGATGTAIATLTPGAGGTGGAGSATRRAPGGPGGSGYSSSVVSLGVGGTGGSAVNFSGGTVGPTINSVNGTAGVANTCAGGGSASNNSGANNQIGAGGGGGEFAYLSLPATTYTYTIGAGGSGGGTATNIGGDGGSGVAFVIEHYGT